MNELNFTQTLIMWYSKFGRKNLPWILYKTPYSVWISEIMLQQTQVSRVIPYFETFLNEFPNIIELACASLDKILYFWSGLGYYARARNLHKTAKIIFENYNGVFPKTFEEIIELPGIGNSTAGAILSLSLNQCYPILDSNVKRILIRYYAIDSSNKKSSTEKKLWNLSKKSLPKKNFSEFNQALMDFGAIICVNQNPKCNFCPLYIKCQFLKKNDLHEIKKKNSLEEKFIFFLLLQKENFVFLIKNPPMGIWGGLFSFPEFSRIEDLDIWVLNHNLQYKKCKQMTKFRHKLSKFQLYITPIHIKIEKTSNIFYLDQNIHIWFDLFKPKFIGLSAPVKNLLEKLKFCLL